MTIKRKKYDVMVIGSGGAGSAAAETAASSGLKVLVVSKDPLVCSDSKISEGIMTVRASSDDSDTLSELSANMRIQGDDLAKESLTQAFSNDSKASYQWLKKQGIKSKTNAKTGQPIPLNLPMGGHTKARSVDHKNGGLDYAHALWNALVSKDNIDYLEDAWLLDLFTSRNLKQHVHGGLIYHASQGQFIAVSAKAVILACGGLSTLYFPNTDTMKGNSGDSYAIAARAGAQLLDMEQIQFIPFAAAGPKSHQGLVVGEPVSAGFLGVIRDKDGKLLKGELMARTRAECSAVIARAVAQGKGTQRGGCYLDLTANSEGKSGALFLQLMKEKIPGILKIVRGAMGSKASRFKEVWEVKPSAHYCMGGINSSDNCEALDHQQQSLSGLYVAGQALGGLHGSNRLGSTSLAEGIIFGRRAGHAAAQFCQQSDFLDEAQFALIESRISDFYLSKFGQAHQQFPINLIRQLQKQAWLGIGPARTEDTIKTCLSSIKNLRQQLQRTHISKNLLWNQSLIDFIECRNMLDCAEFIAVSALQRKRSLGAHVRLDEKNFNKSQQHCSMAVHKKSDETLQIKQLPRVRSSLHRRIKVALKQNTKIAFMKMMRRLPHQYRDPILARIYKKVLNNDHNKLIKKQVSS